MNQEPKNKIKSFTDLRAWQEGHKLVLNIYRITNQFPKSETFGLITQLQRAAVSVTSNLDEGFSRKSYKEQMRFYAFSLGSLTEVQNQLLIARDIGYISNNEFKELAQQSILISKITNGLIKYLKTTHQN